VGFPLRILHLEDDATDAALVQDTLEAGGIFPAITCLHTRIDFEAALERGGIDLILSDFSLPAFDGAAALAMAHARWPAIPLIFVSGTLGEEQAVESLKSGATDYVLKGSLSRLVPAVRRAMLEVETNKQRQRLEAQFVEAQKMDVIGRLACGVAHDFNNILGVIMLYSDLMMDALGPTDRLRKPAEEIRNATDRAATLTQQLLIFGRRKSVQPAVLDLNEVARDMEGLLRRLVHENIEMTIVPGDCIGRVKADPGYVGQVLMNLVVNARDAMPNGGRLTIAVTNVTLEDSYAATHQDATAGDHVMLTVSDTGTGISDEVKARLFEAFFTTKAPGKGTGLGLATCQTIVRQSGGHIGVYSELDHGTTFKVYFPRVDEPFDTTSLPIPDAQLPSGTETLLVVEDERTLRDLARDILEAQGYTVLTASNGREGLDAARDHRGTPIRLVVTDVIMPVMSGKEMAEQLKASHPEMKILFTSGYTDDAITHHGVLEPGVAFLSKPFKRAILLRKIRDLLDDK
jgi:two-component system, cell cycle sensor histidine kinase and response regulator CckA